MKIFMTGISGFLGSHAAQALAAQGHELFALARRSSQTSHLDFPFHRIDGELPACEGLEQTLSEMDAVLHVAGKVKALSPADFHATNALGTDNLVQACLRAHPRPRLFLHISTIAVLDPSSEGSDFCLPPSLCHPVSWYGQSKLEGEKALEALRGKIRCITLRPPVLYGPRDRELLPLFKAARWGISPLFGKGENRLSVCHVRDVADCISSLLASPPPQDEIYCLDDGGVHSWKSLAQDVCRAMGKPFRPLRLPPALFKLGAALNDWRARLSGSAQIFTRNKILEMQQPSWVCGHEKLARERAWAPRIPFSEGCRQTYEFYRKEGWL